SDVCSSDLLHRRLGDLGRCLVETGVDDLVPGVTQRAGDHLRTAVVTVQAWLGDEDATGHSNRKGTQVLDVSPNRRCYRICPPERSDGGRDPLAGRGSPNPPENP